MTSVASRSTVANNLLLNTQWVALFNLMEIYRGSVMWKTQFLFLWYRCAFVRSGHFVLIRDVWALGTPWHQKADVGHWFLIQTDARVLTQWTTVKSPAAGSVGSGTVRWACVDWLTGYRVGRWPFEECWWSVGRERETIINTHKCMHGFPLSGLFTSSVSTPEHVYLSLSSHCLGNNRMIIKDLILLTIWFSDPIRLSQVTSHNVNGRLYCHGDLHTWDGGV